MRSRIVLRKLRRPPRKSLPQAASNFPGWSMWPRQWRTSAAQASRLCQALSRLKALANNCNNSVRSCNFLWKSSNCKPISGLLLGRDTPLQFQIIKRGLPFDFSWQSFLANGLERLGIVYEEFTSRVAEESALPVPADARDLGRNQTPTLKRGRSNQTSGTTDHASFGICPPGDNVLETSLGRPKLIHM